VCLAALRPLDAEQEVSGDKPVDLPVSLALRERPAFVDVRFAGAAEVYVDGRIAATTPIGRSIEVSPGSHVVTVVANGKRPFSQEIRLERGKHVAIQPELGASGQRVVAWSVLGVGAVGLVGGAVLGALAITRESRAEEISDARTERNITTAELEEHNRALEDRDTFRTAALVSASIGGALVASGILLFVFDKPNVAVLPSRTEPGPGPGDKPRDLEISAAPLLGPGLVGGAAALRF